MDIVEDIDLVIRCRIPNNELEEKAIELGFGKGIGAVLFNGVLRGQDDEGIG